MGIGIDSIYSIDIQLWDELDMDVLNKQALVVEHGLTCYV